MVAQSVDARGELPLPAALVVDRDAALTTLAGIHLLQPLGAVLRQVARVASDTVPGAGDAA